MAIWKTELESWLAELGPLDEVAIDEGGLTLLACLPGGCPKDDGEDYIEIGGVPLDEDERHEES